MLLKTITCERRGRTSMGRETGSHDTATWGGPSGFGRCVGAAVFASNEKCFLINQRIGARYLKSGARVACNSDIDQVRNCTAAKAIAEATGGANQYGTEIRAKFPHMIGSEQPLQEQL